MDAATANNLTLGMQGAFHVLSALQMWSSFWPQPATVQDNSIYDFIIVGGGTAGCKIAHGLVQNKDVNVMLIEAGDIPGINSLFAGFLSYLPNSHQDWNYKTENNGFTSQGLKDGKIQLAQGKILGGCSAIDHCGYLRASPADYDSWAAAANDSSWSYDGLHQYFIADEKVMDPKILDSSYKNSHGRNGYVKTRREPHDQIVNPYFNSFKEMGYEPVLDLTDDKKTTGFVQPLLTNHFFRQSNALAYITPIKDLPNFHLMLNSLVTKINIDCKVASGVEVLTKENQTLHLKAKSEVIITAGNFNSPKLLMLSGIGPKEHLESHGINVIADLPVGQNLQDHLSTVVIHAMEEANIPKPRFDPSKFPASVFIGQVALDQSQSYPDYQAVGFIFPNDLPSFIQFCTNAAGFSDKVCEKISKANTNRTILISFIENMHPKSRGTVLLRSSNPLDAPLVIAGSYSDKSDLRIQVSFLEDYRRLENTSYFKNVRAEFVDLELHQCSVFDFGSKEYLECYVLNMAGTTYRFIGTCSLGSVVDAKLRVREVSNLRVADSSIIPAHISGLPKASVNALAGKAVDMIKEDNGIV